MSLGGGSSSVDTSGMEDIYQQALDAAIQQDAWNREFLQTQSEWAAQDRDRLLANNALDREMFYSMLGQDRGFAQDAYNYNQGMSSQAFAYNQGINAQNAAANEADRAMFAQALAEHQASVDAANARSAEEWAWNRGNIEADRAYYDANFKPLEQALIADSAPTAGQYAAESAKAAADVAGAFDNQMGIQRREFARYGVDPLSGRYASANRALGTARSAAEAGAMSQAREGVNARADANRGGALQLGQTHRNTQILNPNHYGSYNMAQFKSSQQNPLTYQQVSYNAPLSTPASYAGFGLPGGFNSAAVGVGQNYGNALQNAANAEAAAGAQESSGLFGALGMIGGAALKYIPWSSRRFKEQIAPFSTDIALRLVREIDPVGFVYKPGMGPAGPRIGAIAEEVPAVFATQERDALDQYNLVGALVGAVQALAERIERLEGGAVA